jgi:hypothetical protein
LRGEGRHQHRAGVEHAAQGHQPFEAGAGTQPADHQPGDYRAAAHAAHQQADAGRAQPQLALADHRQQRPQRRAGAAVGYGAHQLRQHRLRMAGKAQAGQHAAPKPLGRQP